MELLREQPSPRSPLLEAFICIIACDFGCSGGFVLFVFAMRNSG